MVLKRKFDILLVIVFFLFSMWLMDKSFGYDGVNHRFRIARHQIGDFGLHLSLIRSFSLGDNFPPQSPFFPGESLPYHYYFDLFVGLLEKLGLRIDIAFNSLSVISFVLLLFLIYKLSQLIFSKSKLLGVISVLLFLYHSGTTFFDFFRGKQFSISLLQDLWHLPDYLHMGPFDGSEISTYFTLNVYLNQRHLILALAIMLALFYFVVYFFKQKKKVSTRYFILAGILFGLLSRVHTLIFLGGGASLFLLFLFFKQYKSAFLFFTPALFLFGFHLKDIFHQQIDHAFFLPGFLAAKPLSVETFVRYWFLNLGVALVMIPIGFLLGNGLQRKIFLSIFPLFIAGNLFQFGFRIEHNHSLFNLFLIFANFYIAYFLVKLWQGKLFEKLASLVLIIFLTASGVVDLMGAKNDFQLYVADAPKNTFMQWIIDNTQGDDIFLAKQEILDPVTLSGRKNYFGHTYYLSVMGYNYQDRSNRAKLYFEASSQEILQMMKKDRIKYIVIPQKPITDFTYQINKFFLDRSLKKAYKDENVIAYQL